MQFFASQCKTQVQYDLQHLTSNSHTLRRFLIKYLAVVFAGRIQTADKPTWRHSYPLRALPDLRLNNKITVVIKIRTNNYTELSLLCPFLSVRLVITKCKAAKVNPIPKPGKSPSDISSHRPNSLLITSSKLLERGVAHRLNSFTQQNHILPLEQYGLRKIHSTVSRLATITAFFTHGFNLRRQTGMILNVEKKTN